VRHARARGLKSQLVGYKCPGERCSYRAAQMGCETGTRLSEGVWVPLGVAIDRPRLCHDAVAMQNIYDNEEFFTNYQVMRSARAGINEAIEQPALLSVLPCVEGLHVVDLGCGDGHLCRLLANKGAANVLGVDPSERMLTLARKRTNDPRVGYQQGFAEEVCLPNNSVNLVTSSLALHYVADLAALVKKVAGWLTRPGWFAASMEHPVVTAAPRLGHDPCIVDDYAREDKRDTTWYVDGVIKYHRRVSTIVNTLIDSGLLIERLLEPTPTPESLNARPELALHQRRPAVLVVAATKPIARDTP